MKMLQSFRFWAIIFALAGLLSLVGATSLLLFSRLPQTGWLQLLCGLLFFGVAALFWRLDSRI